MPTYDPQDDAILGDGFEPEPWLDEPEPFEPDFEPEPEFDDVAAGVAGDTAPF